MTNGADLVGVFKVLVALGIVGSMAVVAWTAVQAWPHQGPAGSLVPPHALLLAAGTGIAQLALVGYLYRFWTEGVLA